MLDFYKEIGKINIEIDGDRHLEDNVIERDLERDNILRKDGVRIYRISTVDEPFWRVHHGIIKAMDHLH